MVSAIASRARATVERYLRDHLGGSAETTWTIIQHRNLRQQRKQFRALNIVPIKQNKELAQSKQIFRHWVEVRDLKTGVVRQLPLKTVVKICFAPKRAEPECPRQEVLQVADGSATIEAKDLGDLAAQLRQKYPDDAYVRTLHRQRDTEAEVQRTEAINRLSEILLPRAYLCPSAVASRMP